MVIDLEHFTWADFYLHNRGQIFFPNFLDRYGSKRFFCNPSRSQPANYRAIVELEKTGREAIDNEDERCGDSPNADLATCVAEYVEQRVGCRTGMAGGNLSRCYIAICNS